MAKVLSGNFSTNPYGNLYLNFSWTATQSIANNQTTISWELWSRGSYSGYYMSAPIKLTIEGSVVYEKTGRFELRTNTKLASNTLVLTHSLTGTKSFSASVEAAIYSGSANCSGSGAWDLVDIPRGATITSAPNFTDEDSPEVIVSNPANASLQAAIYKEDGTTAILAYRAFNNGNKHKFTFTDADRAKLWAATPNSNTLKVRFYVKSTIGSNSFWSYSTKTLTIKNPKPTISPTVIDIGSGSLSLTGNNPNAMIKGFNGMRATINATAQKGASITSVKITNGGTVKTTNVAEFWYATDNVFNFSATDSRGNTTTGSITRTPFVEYVRLSCAITKANVSTSGQYVITAKGNCFAGSFGAVNNNVRIHYKWREKGAEWGAWTTLPHTVSGTTYTATTTITGLDYKKAYELQVAAMDDIGSSLDNQFAALTDVLTLSSVPVFDWSKSDFRHHTNISFDLNNRIYGLDADGNAYNAFEPWNQYNVTSIGYGGYSAKIGATQIHGDKVQVKTNNGFFVDGSVLNDFVIEQGVSSGGWTYRKWKSGLRECWIKFTLNTAITTAWGSMYVGNSKTSKLNYPFTFAEIPMEYATARSTDGAMWVYAESGGTGQNSKTQSGVYNVCRPTALNSSQSITISLYVVGKQ